MKNINDFVAWYADKYNKPLPSVTSSAQVERTDKIKNHILSGLAAGGVLTFPNVTGEVTDVRISVPSQYTLSINGYQTRQLSVTEYQVLVSGTQPQLTLQYQLGVASPQQLNVLSPAVVQAVVTTSEKADIAVAKEKIEEVSVADASTDTSIDKSTSPDATNGSTTPTPAVPKTETKVTTVYEPESKEFKREYSASSTLFPYESYAGDSESATLFADIHGYLELAAIVQTIFGTDLRQSFDASVAGKNGLLNSADMESLKTIIVNLIKESTISSLKSSLQVPQEEIDDLNNKKVQGSELEATIQELKSNTGLLVEQLDKVLQEANTVNETLASKPALTTTEVVDNTSMVTVTAAMNADLVQLMAASRNLMENTKSNQAVAETINQSLTQLRNDVSSLENEGTGLSGRVEELNTIMATDYKDNEAFLQAFAGVLSNTKNGNEKNQAVYEYLSNPVDAKNISSVLGVTPQAAVTTPVARDERSPFLTILISFITSLGLAYALQHTKWMRGSENGERVSWSNAIVPMSVLSGVAVISGLMIFAIMGSKLDVIGSQFITLMMAGVVLLLVFSYSNNLLLKYFKHIGFLVSIGLLMLYIISASQLFDVQFATTNQGIASVSPLTYTEKMFQLLLSHQEGWGLIFGILLFLIPALGGLNAYLYKEMED
ncbi:putative nuclease with TOPRIM domain [Streptococcus gallinaceus]|uniref:hypothetical protein n=1 Tax=Streptococcus gallinaceus TaxID=165758 RepID=UPI00209F2267|nr:hypothetical protein [Streptococcus gallinaceus]MCP1639194.1 putative nuclease with TOPRIM domain [Streptococcus gallinaceus]